ncbi:MAG: dynamin family protein [Cyanobacteriota bacterium]
MDINTSKIEIKKLISDIIAFCSKNSITEKNVSILQEKFTKNEINLTVLGEFNRGKSTFVNSLIGDDILPSGVTPTTASINILKHSNQTYAKVLYLDEKNEMLSLSKESFQNLNYENIDHIEIGHNSPFLRNIIIIDTPGVNDINTQKIEVTYNFIPKSDAVIFLLDAEQVLSKSEFDFFQNKILSSDINKIIFVINKTDNLKANELNEVMDYAHKKLSKYVNNPIIVHYSAKNALSAKKSNNDKELENSNYINLKKAITDNVFDKKDSILINRTSHSLNLIINSLITKLNFEKGLFVKPLEELENNLKHIKENESSLNNQLETLLKEFREEIKILTKNEISNLRTFSLSLNECITNEFDDLSYQDIKTYLPSFIQDKFKDQVEAQEINIKAVTIEIYQNYIEKLGKIFENIKKELDFKIDLDQLKLKTINKTSNSDLGSSILMTSGLTVMFLGGLFPLIGGILMVATGGFLSLSSKETREKSLKEDLKKLANNSITHATEKISIKLDNIIEEISLKIQDNLKELFKDEFESINNSFNSVIEDKKVKEIESSVKIEEIDKEISFLIDKNKEVIRILEINTL